MKTFKTLLLGLCIVMCACSTQTPRQTNEYGTNWQWENGTIVIETPERPAGPKKRVGTDCPEDGSSTRRIRRTGACAVPVRWNVSRIYRVHKSWHFVIMSSRAQRDVRNT